MYFCFGGEFLLILVTFPLIVQWYFRQKIDVDHSWVNKNLKIKLVA